MHCQWPQCNSYAHTGDRFLFRGRLSRRAFFSKAVSHNAEMDGRLGQSSLHSDVVTIISHFFMTKTFILFEMSIDLLFSTVNHAGTRNATWLMHGNTMNDQRLSDSKDCDIIDSETVNAAADRFTTGGAIIVKKVKHSSCTAVLVGKGATIDGSTIIARNEDADGAINPKRFTVIKAADHPKQFSSKVNAFSLDLPNDALRHTFTPCADNSAGVWGEAGINTDNVAMSATETEFTNPHVLGLDPLVHDGIGEEAMESVVLPYIHSAREGVRRLGAIIEKYGTFESNGIAFSDKDEVWYMETVGGHHWAAQRIPDDAYVIAPNQTGIQEIDFSKPDEFMWSTDLREFAARNHLNPSDRTFNFRNLFGTHTLADHHYNTPRAWYGQKYLNPEIEQDPISDELPFFRKPSHKVSIEDVQYILGSHYQETPYDVFGNGSEKQKHTFRPIGIDRNQEFHILQIRGDVPEGYAAIHWLTFGVNLYSAQVPFYANVSDTPENYKNTTGTVDLGSTYWLNKTIAALAEPQYHRVINTVNAFKDDAQSYVVGRIAEIDRQASELKGSELIDFLTEQNAITAAEVTRRTYALFDQLVKEASNHMLLSFEKGRNL